MRRFKNFVREFGQQMSGSSESQDQDEKDYIDKMIESLTTEVDALEEPNMQMLTSMFMKMKRLFEESLGTDLSQYTPDMKVYTSQDISNYDLEFLSQIDPRFVQDLEINWNWYLNSYRETP